MFTDKIDLIICISVSSTVRKNLIPKGIGTVIWSWTYDEGQLITKKFNNLIYFPEPPVNILSTTALSESMKDDQEAWV